MQRILSCAGEWFNMDYFYANDSKAWGETGSRSAWPEGNSYGSSSLHKAPAFIEMQQMEKAVNDIREKTKSKRNY
jgi:thymidylate synthase